MRKEIRFPKQERLARGRNGFFETSGVVATTEFGDVVTLLAITGKGDVSESARLVLPVSHLREFRDAIDSLIPKESRDIEADLQALIAKGLNFSHCTQAFRANGRVQEAYEETANRLE